MGNRGSIGSSEEVEGVLLDGMFMGSSQSRSGEYLCDARRLSEANDESVIW